MWWWYINIEDEINEHFWYDVYLWDDKIINKNLVNYMWWIYFLFYDIDWQKYILVELKESWEKLILWEEIEISKGKLIELNYLKYIWSNEEIEDIKVMEIKKKILWFMKNGDNDKNHNNKKEKKDNKNDENKDNNFANEYEKKLAIINNKKFYDEIKTYLINDNNFNWDNFWHEQKIKTYKIDEIWKVYEFLKKIWNIYEKKWYKKCY